MKRSKLKLLLIPAASFVAVLLCALPAMASAALSAEVLSNSPPAKFIKVLDDLPYRSGPSKAWRLDLAMPKNFGGQRHPALVIVHGGGWGAGSKRDRPYRTLLLDYALKGYVTISVDYRLTGEAPFPACIEDVKCAVRWLRAHADQYQVDPDRIGAFGHSAGAHLVMMLALCPASAGLEGDGGWNEYSSRPNAVAAGATPTSVRGRGPDADKWSPLTYITSNAPPVLLLQGTKDEIVPVESVDQFVEKLKQAGAPDVNYVRVEGGNHATAYEHFLDSTMSAMSRFFDRTLASK